MRTRGLRGGVLAVVLVAAVAGCSGDGDGPAGPPPSTRQGVDPAGSPPPVATQTPAVAVSSAPAVEFDRPASLKPRVVVTIGERRTVDVEAVPGEVAGRAVAVQVRVRNDADRPFSLTGMVVTASFGDGVPGEPSSAKPSNQLTGELAAGKSASGTYVFRVPRGTRASSLQVQVSSDESPTIVQFGE